MDADELLHNARALARHAAECARVVPPQAALGMRCSEAAMGQLLDECEEQFSQLQQLQNEITMTKSDSLETSRDETVNRVNALAAELKQWMETEPKLLSTNSEILLTVGKEELLQLNTQLEMVFSCSQAKRNKLKEVLKSEQKWLEEKREVLMAVTEQVTALQQENDKLSETSVLHDMKKKIQKVKEYQDHLLDTLSDVLEEHFPLPQQAGNTNKKKKNSSMEPRKDLISLHNILELLMNKTVETPHEPYVVIDETFWPPYIEMLLRYGIASRHPDDYCRIRLEAFY
ncbi:centromere protein K isoform X2 [Scleropages formosus]|uniref:Centromere protein K n=1 Tax=Scleropages formosus TaxID=113540 RepID=A0A8C9QVE2_SCLFO|nr:centromere protein K isoform X2 [Scleropages formosus]